MLSQGGFNIYSVYAICVHLGSAWKVCVFSTYLFVILVLPYLFN